MNRTFKAAVVVLILAYGIAGSAVAGLFEDGLNAWERGDYSTAMRPLADRGDPKAQYGVGVMYQHGWGAPLDYSDAVRWFQQAANQGGAESQNHLGFMFLYGRGVSQNYVGAHMWFNLAASGGNTYAVFARDLVAAKMTPTQLAEARKLARMWKPK